MTTSAAPSQVTRTIITWQPGRLAIMPNGQPGFVRYRGDPPEMIFKMEPTPCLASIDRADKSS